NIISFDNYVPRKMGAIRKPKIIQILLAVKSQIPAWAGGKGCKTKRPCPVALVIAPAICPDIELISCLGLQSGKFILIFYYICNRCSAALCKSCFAPFNLKQISSCFPNQFCRTGSYIFH